MRAGRLPWTTRGAVAGLLALLVALPLDGVVREEVGRRSASHEFRLVANGFTALGSFWVAGGMLGALAAVGQRVGDAALVRASVGGLVGIAIGGVVGYVVKQLTCRARPRAAPPLADRGRAGLVGFFARWPCLTASRFQSFPSGHANTAFGLASALIAAAPGRRRLWLGLAAAVSASRLVVNAHFLSDVVAGALLGWSAGQGGQRLWRRLSAQPRPAVGTAPRGVGP
jgi:membrane-associated phospholipid phosphatase